VAIRLRHQLVGLLTVGAMINFIDRVNISVAAPTMMEKLGWDKAQFGVIFSAFLAGYTLFQFPGGIIADKWNAKRVIALSCLGFSVFTALTPLAGVAFVLMVVIRFCVGAFESMSFPAYATMNSRWTPRHEYSRAQTVSLSGSYLGQTIAYPLTTWLVSAFAWPVVFYFNALLGVLWMIVLIVVAANTPREHPRITPEEIKEIEGNVAVRSKVAVSPWIVLKSRPVVMLSLSYMCLIFGVWMILLWLPTYLVEGRGFSKQEMGLIGMIPTLGSFAGLVGGGVMSDRLLKRGLSIRAARVRAPALCIALGIPFLVAAVLVPWGWVSVGCVAAYMFTINLSTGGYWSVPLELNPPLVGAISGVMTCAGNFGGIFGPMTAGYIFKATGSWPLPYLIAAAFALLSFIFFYFFVDPEPIEIDSFRAEPSGLEPAADPA
jgi:MFS family permease